MITMSFTNIDSLLAILIYSYKESRIIPLSAKYSNIPRTRGDKIASYRKKHSDVRHQYLALNTQHSGLSKCMLNFTVKGRGRGVYTKLRIANEIKSYITYLISNSKADIYFFTNIELGSHFKNPHVHSQLWHDDIEAVEKIYAQVIKEFSLTKKYCKLSLPQQKPQHYNYVLKDYASTLTDDQVWNLEQIKIRMRKQLGTKLRFYSRSKSKYTSKMYKMVYHSFRVLRAYADKFLDLVTSTLFFKRDVIEDLLYSKKFIKCFTISGFIIIKNKEFLNCWKFPNSSSYGLDVLFYSPALDPPFS